MKEFINKIKTSRFWGVFKKVCVWFSFGLNFLFLLLLIIGFVSPSVKMASAADNVFDYPSYRKTANANVSYCSYTGNSDNSSITLANGADYPVLGLSYGSYPLNRTDVVLSYSDSDFTYDNWRVERFQISSNYYVFQNGVLVPSTYPSSSDIPYLSISNFLYVYNFTSGGNKYLNFFVSSTLSFNYFVEGFPGYHTVGLDWYYRGSFSYFVTVGSGFYVGEGSYLLDRRPSSLSRPPIDKFPSWPFYGQPSYSGFEVGQSISSVSQSQTLVQTLVTSSRTNVYFPYSPVEGKVFLYVNCLCVPTGQFVFTPPDNVLVGGWDGLFDNGYTSGYQDGDKAGYDRGLSQGISSASPITSFSGIISNAFTSISSILNMDLFGLSLGTWLFIPVVVGLIFLVLRIFNHG